ncbi:Endochitinase [Bienertia sinuspersici]
MKMKNAGVVMVLLIMMAMVMGSSAGFRCGRIAHNSSCPDGFCCNMSGYCGKTHEFCGKGRCQSQCLSDNDTPQTHPSPSTTARIRSRKIPTK